MKENKSKRIILTVFVLIFSMLISGTIALAAGGSEAGEAAAAKKNKVVEGGEANGAYKDNGGLVTDKYNKLKDPENNHLVYLPAIYAFDIRPGNNSSSEIINGKGRSDIELLWHSKGCETGKDGDKDKRVLGGSFDHFTFNLDNEANVKGETGVLYKNYIYHNRITGEAIPIDVKLTLNGWNYVEHVVYASDGQGSSGDNKKCVCSGYGFKHPVVAIGSALKSNTVYPYFTMANITNLNVRYDYYKAGTDEKIDLTASATWNDIDDAQSISIYDTNNKYMIVSNNSVLGYAKDEHWHVFLDRLSKSGETSSPANAVAFSFNGSATAMKYTSAQHKPNGEITWGTTHGARSTFKNVNGFDDWSIPFEPFPMSKIVYDYDNVTKTGEGGESYADYQNYFDSGSGYTGKENTVETPASNWYYRLNQKFPNNWNASISTFSKYKIIDEFDTEFFELASDPVVRNGKKEDITNLFTFDRSNGLTATLKDGEGKNQALYNGNGLNIVFSMKLKSGKTLADLVKAGYKVSSDGYIQMKNTCWNEAEDSEGHDLNPKDENGDIYKSTTLTNIGSPKPKKNVPTKEVSDNDNRTLTGTGAEKNVKENTIDKVGDTYTYHIKHKVKDDETVYSPGWFFKTYKITDKVKDLLLIQDGAKVYEGSNDVTSKFDIEVSSDKHTITATAKTAELAKEAFYGKTYELRFNVKIDKNNYSTSAKMAPWRDSALNGRVYTWLNDATVDITDEVDPADPNSEDGKGAWSKKTNEVKTHIMPSKPKKNVPTKEVSDSDNRTLTGTGAEKNVKENTLDKVGNVYTYHIKHKVKDDADEYMPFWYFKSYKITDKVAELLLIQDGAKVYEGSTDVTSKFDISVSSDKKTITATAKTAELGKDAFYGKTYELRFNVKIDAANYNTVAKMSPWKDSALSGRVYTWLNSATVDITDNANPYDPNSEDGKGSWSKKTNEVKTHIMPPKPKKNAPTKEVSDSDNRTLTGTGAEKNVKENTLDKVGNVYTYHIKHKVKDDADEYMPFWYFKSYKITDKVADLLLIQDGAKVYEGSTDVTSKFDIAVSADKKTITATAKTAELGKDAFYRKTYELRFNVKIDAANYNTVEKMSPWKDSALSGRVYTWLNSATVDITDNANPYDQNSEDGKGTWSKKTNEVKTHIMPPKPKKNAPTKEVSDSDNKTLTGTGTEKNVKENTLDKAGDAYTYHVKHKIGDGADIWNGAYNQHWFFKSYKITDKVEDLLLIQDGAKVYEGSTDVTNKFDIAVSSDKKTITATAKTAELGKDAFYGKTYELRFNVKIDRDKYKTESQLKPWIDSKYNGRILTWHNSATVDITDNVDPYDPNSEDEKGRWSKKTNDTTTHIQLPKPKKNVPVKQVTDSNNKTLKGNGAEERVNENTLEIAEETYTYHVRHRLGSGVNDVWNEGAYSSYWFFKSYKMTDKVEDLLLIQNGAKVYEYTWDKNNTNSTSGEKDVTSKFDIVVSQDKKIITATAKAGSLTAEDFYNVKMYELRFNAKIDTNKYKYESDLSKWATENDKGTKNILIKWPNKSAVDITDNVDPYDTNSEDGKGTWKKDTNTVQTNLWIPTPDGDIPEDPNDPRDQNDSSKPGLSIVKTTKPYEFRVGETIPYTITITQKNKDAVAYLVEAEDTDLPKGFTIDKESVKAEGGTEPKAWVEGDNTLKITAKYLKHGEKLVVTFNGTADKDLNGKVVPNEVIGRAWGTHEEDKSTWDRDHTSVYINSPKADITKTIKKKANEDGSVTYQTGDSVQFTTVITNKNPGTFMRNIYALDTSETEGLVINPSTIKVMYNSKTDSDRLVSLKEGRDYVVETYDAGETIPMDNLGMKIGSREAQDYEVKTATPEENEKAESEKGTGAVLPTKNEGGFIIKFLGKYRNLGYTDKAIPTTEDERGKVVKYLADELKAIEEENGVDYTTDYENLNLQNKLVITYSMTVENEDLAGNALNNFIRIPATENTNNDMINDDDSIPSGGDYARSNLKANSTILKHEKEVKEESTCKDGVLHYTLTSKNSSEERAYDVVISDGFTSGNAVMNKDVKVKLGDKDITESCTIEYQNEEKPTGFKVQLNREFKPGEEMVITYTGTTTSEEPDKVHNETALTARGIDPIKDEKDVPVEKTPEVIPPTPEHVKSVQEKQHDGPEGKINELHYTLNSKNVADSTVKNVVITDEILTNNFDYNKDVKIALNGEDVTDKVKITYKDSENAGFIIETRMDLEPGDEFITTYSGKVKDNNVIQNSSTLTADGIDGIKDEKVVPGPDPAAILSAEKASEPENGATVKVGDNIKYIITLENKGNADANDAVIRDYIPEGTNYVSAENDGKFNEDKGYVDWYPLNIKAGEKVDVTFTIEVTEAALDKMAVKNQALYQNDFDPEKGNNPSSVTNIVEHPVVKPETPPDEPTIVDEPDKPVDEPPATDEPVIDDEPENPDAVDEPKTPDEDPKNKKADSKSESQPKSNSSAKTSDNSPIGIAAALLIISAVVAMILLFKKKRI